MKRNFLSYAVVAILAMLLVACGKNGINDADVVHQEGHLESSVDNRDELPTDLVEPTAVPTEVPTATPTAAPTEAPTAIPTAVPTEAPTATPTAVPTEAPTATPTATPIAVPTEAPTATPTAVPTEMPTEPETELSKLVAGILSKIINTDMNELEKVLVIHDYITYNMDYDYENYLNNRIPATSYSAYGAFTTGRAVCSGYAEAFFELAKAAELEVLYVSGMADNGSGAGPEGHAWNQVKVNGAWYNMDTCWDDGTWEGKLSDDHSANSYTYCLVSDRVLYEDHETNVDYVHACAKSYDPVEIGKGVAKVNTYKPIVFVENTEGFQEAILCMVETGDNSFEIMTLGEGRDYWEQITSAIRVLRLPLWVKYQSVSNAVAVYKIEEKENAYIAGSPAEAKKAIEAYKGRLDELELWYYDDTMDDNNQWSIVNDALCKTGYAIEAESMTMVYDGMVQCHVAEVENVLQVDDLAELVEYWNYNGMEALKEKKIWYATQDISTWSLSEKLKETFISSGYLVDCMTDNLVCSEVIKFVITDVQEVKYIGGINELESYVAEIGLENLVGKEFYIKNSQRRDSVEVVKELFEALQCQASFTLTDWGSVIGVCPDVIFCNPAS